MPGLAQTRMPDFCLGERTSASTLDFLFIFGTLTRMAARQLNWIVWGPLKCVFCCLIWLLMFQAVFELLHVLLYLSSVFKIAWCVLLVLQASVDFFVFFCVCVFFCVGTSQACLAFCFVVMFRTCLVFSFVVSCFEGFASFVYVFVMVGTFVSSERLL